MEDTNKLSVQDDDKSTSTSEVKVATEDVEYASDPELEDLLESAVWLWKYGADIIRMTSNVDLWC